MKLAFIKQNIYINLLIKIKLKKNSNESKE